jgi:hypothetical protein
MHDVQVQEGKVVARAETLRSLASALGVRCEATYSPDEWAFLETLAGFHVEPGPVSGAVLVSTAWNVREVFESHDAAVLECVRRVRQVAEQTRKAMSEVK